MAHRPSADEAVDLGVYADVLRRRWRLLVAVVTAFVALAALYSFTRPAMYTAEAQVLVDPGRSSSGLRPEQLVSIDTEGRLVASASIAAIARRQLGFTPSTADLLDRVSVETTPDSLVIDISFTAPTRAAAADAANAFAEGYLSYRRDRAEDSLAEERSALQEMVNQLELERDAENAAMDAAVRGSIEFRNARSRRDILNQEIAILAAQLTQIPVTADPGEVILPATPQAAEPSPNHVIDVAIGLFLGAFAGTLAAFLRDRTDDRIGGRAELESALGAPTLAIIPRIVGRSLRRTPFLVVEHQPRSPAAEAYRTLRTSVMAHGRQRGVRVIGVTGAAMNEGKTTTVANLSAALAQADQNVLAISADLRRPRLHEFFSLRPEPGLSDVLAGKVPLQAVIRKGRGNVHVVTSGAFTEQPAELLQSPKMSDVVQIARSTFDFVIFDLPPVLGLADTLTIAPLLDGLVVVAEADRTRQAAIRHTVDQIIQVGAVIDGGVLSNVVPSRFSDYRYGYGYEPPNGSSDRNRSAAVVASTVASADDEPEATSGNARPTARAWSARAERRKRG